MRLDPQLFRLSIAGLGLYFIVQPVVQPLIQTVALNILKMGSSAWLLGAKFSASLLAAPALAVPLLVNGMLMISAAMLAVVAVRYLVIPLGAGVRLHVSQETASVPNTYRPLKMSSFTSDCLFVDNRVRLTVSAPNMQDHPARCLKVLADVLPLVSNLSTVKFSCVYSKQPGSDNGGLRREVIDDFLRKILEYQQASQDGRLQFSMHNNGGPDLDGYYTLKDSGHMLEGNDLELCQNIGVLMGALCAGFAEGEGCKLAYLFSPHFYRGILYLATKRTALADMLGGLSDSAEINRLLEGVKSAFCVHLAMHNPSDPLHGLPLMTLVDLENWNDNTLEEWKTTNQSDKRRRTHLMILVEYFQVIAEEGVADPSTAAELQAMLQNSERRKEIALRIQANCTESYGQEFAPLRAVEEGVSRVPTASQALLRRARNPHRQKIDEPKQLAEFIQGKAFTEANFLSKLPRKSVFEAKQVQWVYEWLDPSREGFCSRLYRWIWKIETPRRASDKERLLFMKYVTGAEGLGKEITGVDLNTHVNGFVAHTCSRNLDVPNINSREELIKDLRIAILPQSGEVNFSQA